MDLLQHEFKVAVMGEIMMTRPISVYEEPEFLSVIKLLKDADVAITNIEGYGFTGFKGYPIGKGGQTNMCGDTWIADEFKWAGFNLVSVANNHSLDFGLEGFKAALDALDKIRLTYAGAGKDLWEARQPAYLETRKGRAAMVASNSSYFQLGGFPSPSLLTAMATESGKGLPGRPGINPLRHDIIYTVTREQFDQIKKIKEECKIQTGTGWHYNIGLHPKIDAEEINFLGCRIAVGEKPGVQYVALKQDVEGNLQSIKYAKKNASLVVVSNHSHETDPDLRSDWGNAPAAFIRKYAKDCIDAGADIFYGHGDHTGEGIEIYKDKPIFYSFADPIVTSPNIKRLALEEYERVGLSYDSTVLDWQARARGNYAGDRWVQSVLPTFTMRDGKLTEIKLYPIDSGAGEPVGTSLNRGVRPFLVKDEEARKIIERYAGLSAPLGTEIEYKDGIGIIKGYS